MSNKDYFSVSYKILSYLKYCYEHGTNPDVDFLQASTFNISQQQFLQTLKMLSDDGHLTGLNIVKTTTGELITGLDQAKVTSSGLQYLAENSMMQKAARFLRNWLPLIK